MQSHPLIPCTTFCISTGLMSFSPNPQYTFRSVPHTYHLMKLWCWYKSFLKMLFMICSGVY
ncbi:hypothetical protein DWZ41_20315 [Bacteroides sp. AF32-15BH]|nr:hypothetical protein DWZ41_20315 [Bacteroides sp. AF32-15BH]